MNTTLGLGLKAEDIAMRYLQKSGLRIVAKNVRYPFGELDLVALENDVLVFIEVKYRKTTLYSEPFEAVTRQKQKKIIHAAQAYLQKLRQIPSCRFDVVSLSGELSDPCIDHIKDAFWS